MAKMSIVITGGGHGLGKKFAFDLAKSGHNVFICDEDQELLNKTLDEFQDLGLPVRGELVDVVKEDQVVAFYQRVMDEVGSLDISINNADMNDKGSSVNKQEKEKIQQLLLEKGQPVMDINLNGVFQCAREAAFHMIETKTKGVIISMSSISRNGDIAQTNQSTIKTGISNMIRTLATGLARYGIRAVALAPDQTKKNMVRLMNERGESRIQSNVCSRYFDEHKGISQVLQFIFGHEFVNGTTLEIDNNLLSQPEST